MNERLIITMIGELGLSYAGKPIRTQSRKSEVLLACLALSGTGQMSRQYAAGLLWSDGTEEAARTSLRQAVMTIKRALQAVGFEGFDAGRDHIRLDLASVETDVQTLHAEARAGKVPDLASLHRFHYAESLLKGLDDLDESLAAWLSLQRQVWRDAIGDALQAGLQAASGKPTARQAWARAILAFEPSNEPVARLLMEMRGDAADFAGALSVYADLAKTLKEDFDDNPSTETRRLADVIKARQSANRTAARTRSYNGLDARHEPNPVIVVSPVPDTVSDPQLAAILSGLRFELISLLVRFREWSVVDWTPVNGSVNRPAYTILFSGHAREGRFAYSITLRDERDGTFIWSDTFRGGKDTLHEVEETFVRRMAAALNIHISADRLRRFSTSNAIPASHFDAWAKAQQLMQRWRDPEDNAAFELLDGIIRDLPTFGPAHSALAQHANGRHIVCPGNFRDTELTLNAFRHASTARLLDPLDAKAHLCLGWTHALLGQFNEAAGAFRDALQLNINDPWVLTSATHGLAFCGATAEVETLCVRIRGLGISLAPEHWSYLAGIQFLSGNYTGCIEAARHVEHGYYGMKTWTIAALAETGEIAAARQEADALFKALVRDWRSNRAASPLVAGDWLADMFPIRDQAVRRQLRGRLAESGLA